MRRTDAAGYCLGCGTADYCECYTPPPPADADAEEVERVARELALEHFGTLPWFGDREFMAGAIAALRWQAARGGR